MADERLTDWLRAECQRLGVDTSRINITTVDGVVYLRGRETDSALVDALVGAARSAPGAPDVVFQFGMPGWVPVAGDWDGGGHTGVGVYDPTTATWYLRGSAGAGFPDRVFQYGAPGWKPGT